MITNNTQLETAPHPLPGRPAAPTANPKLAPAAPDDNVLTPNQRCAEMTDHVIHHLAASSVLLQALIAELDSGSLVASDLRLSLRLLHSEAQATKRTVLGAAAALALFEHEPTA